MNAQTANNRWFEDMVDAVNLPDSSVPWLQASRQQAKDNISTLDMPARKQETWRYSNVDELFKHRYRYYDEQFTALDDDDIDAWVYAEEDSHRLVFANGRCVPALSNISRLPDNIVIGSLRAIMSTDPELVNHYLAHNTWAHNDRFNELNRALLNDGLFIHVPENVVVEKPIEVVYLNISHDEQTLSAPRSVVALQTGAQATLIERYTSLGDTDYFFNGITEVYLQPSARLRHYRLQGESRQAHHLSRVALSQASASEYKGINVAMGGSWSRTDIYAHIEGEHARCELDGLYLVGDKQQTDYHLDVQHKQPHSVSRENFRGIIHGKGRAVFDGRILVNKAAQKTDAQLSNKNLLMVENAEVDTKPQLEIYADDVKCSHGTTVGRIDPNQLFYLRSRGIAEQKARMMLCAGFAEQILAEIEDRPVYEFIQTEITKVFSEARRP